MCSLQVMVIVGCLVLIPRSSLVSARWQLTWNDEFDAPEVDTTHWNIYTNWSQLSNQVEIYIPRNVYTSDGNLILRTTKEPYEFQHQLFNYTSGRVDTLNKFAQTFGRWEIRAKLPNPYASGVHPAHWLLGMPPNCWPVCSEIDIMEQTADYTNVYTTRTLHFGRACGHDDAHIPSAIYPSAAEKNTVNFTSTYHVFAVEWNATDLLFFVDDLRIVDLHASANISIPQWDMFTILSSAVMRAQRWPQPDWVWPVYHVIDYVRVYKWVPEEVEAALWEESWELEKKMKMKRRSRKKGVR